MQYKRRMYVTSGVEGEVKTTVYRDHVSVKTPKGNVFEVYDTSPTAGMVLKIDSTTKRAVASYKLDTNRKGIPKKKTFGRVTFTAENQD